MKIFCCSILQMRHTAIDGSNLMDLSMTIVETKFQTITFSYNISPLKLKLSFTPVFLL